MSNTIRVLGISGSLRAKSSNTGLLRAAAGLSAGNSQLGVTALTEAALRRAEALAGGAGSNLTLAQIAEARAQIQSAFGVADIFLAPALVDELADMARLGSTAADQYALRLAALAEIAAAELGNAEANPALRMAQALAADLADGKIDGNGVAGDLPYDVASFAAQFQAQALALVQANAQQLVVTDDAAPLRGGKAEARGGVGLVDRDVDRMQEGIGHAQKSGQRARGIGHGHIDANAQCLRVRHRRLAGHRSRRRGDDGRGNRESGCH